MRIELCLEDHIVQNSSHELYNTNIHVIFSIYLYSENYLIFTSNGKQIQMDTSDNLAISVIFGEELPQLKELTHLIGVAKDSVEQGLKQELQGLREEMKAVFQEEMKGFFQSELERI